MARKRARVTAADVESAQDALVAALESSRATRVLVQDKKASPSAIRESNLAVEEAEELYLTLLRVHSEQNVEDAGEALGAEVVWGKREK